MPSTRGNPQVTGKTANYRRVLFLEGKRVNDATDPNSVATFNYLQLVGS